MERHVIDRFVEYLIRKQLLLPDVCANPTPLKFDTGAYSNFRDRRTQAIFEISNGVVNPELD